MAGLVEGAMKLREGVSAAQTVARARISKYSQSPATRSKRKKAEDEARVKQARVKLDAGHCRSAKSNVCAIELEKELEQRSSHLRVSDSKYLLLTIRHKR